LCPPSRYSCTMSEDQSCEPRDLASGRAVVACLITSRSHTTTAGTTVTYTRRNKGSMASELLTEDIVANILFAPPRRFPLLCHPLDRRNHMPSKITVRSGEERHRMRRGGRRPELS